MFRIGCDVGGTNTDAAILDITRLSDSTRGVLATCKTSTTSNVTDGIRTAIENVLVQSAIDRGKVINVAIGTTHFVNAVVENDTRHLERVAVVRLCGPYTRRNKPFLDWPFSLREVVEGPVFYLDGGLEVDGREISALNPEQVRKAAKAIAQAGIRAVAVVGVFSALDHEGRHEETCKKLMLEIAPDLSIVCSHSIGGPGLLLRENATILNATILSFARSTIEGFRKAIEALSLECPLFLTQNDGTLVEASAAAEIPVKTFASGPTNSLMGAAFLRDLTKSNTVSDQQVLVVDVGGTTTDVCALLPSGFPRKAPSTVSVGGVRTAFSMPEVFSIGLGGGSRVRVQAGGGISVGPDSVAYRLTTESKIFGGNTLTTSDIAVASGNAQMGNPNLVKDLAVGDIKAAKKEIKRIVEKAIDKMKVSAAPVKVLLVGGGSVIVDGVLEGVNTCTRPPHHDSANAVGAAIAGVSGEVDIIEVLLNQDEAVVLEHMKQKAITAAIKNGADEADVRIVDVDKIPLQYVNNKATRFIIKAVGSLKHSADGVVQHTKETSSTYEAQSKPKVPIQTEKHRAKSQIGSLATPTLGVDLETYRPKVEKGVWHLSSVDVELIACGCGVLGTGGGGSSYDEALYVLDIIANGGTVRIIPPASLKDTDVCVFGAGYGAPSVSNERIDSGDAVFFAIEQLNKLIGIRDFDAVVAAEIGGGNGLVTFPTGAHFDKPVVDCDLMGRAYPTIEHCTPYLFGQPVAPCAIADSKCNVSVVVNAESNTKMESLLRTACVELGNSAATASQPLSGKVMKQYAVPNTVSQAWFLGRAVHIARQKKIDIVQAIGDVMPVKLLYTGKIIDVTRDVSKGYTMGSCTIAPLSEEEQDTNITGVTESRSMIVPFQNEYLAAYYAVDSDAPEKRNVACIVPDLISILGQDGEALGSPDLRYGLQVSVIGMPAHPHWTGTSEGLRVGGPEFFQLDMPWTSIGEYQVPRSVFDEFSC